MEEFLFGLLAAVCEFLGDALLEIAGQAIFAFFSHVLGYVFKPRSLNRALDVSIYVVFGAMAGWISVLVFPHPLVRASRFHGISLLISPLLAGSVMSSVGSALRRKGKRTTQIETFVYGFAFAFAMALVRFLFVK